MTTGHAADTIISSTGAMMHPRQMPHCVFYYIVHFRTLQRLIRWKKQQKKRFCCGFFAESIDGCAALCYNPVNLFKMEVIRKRRTAANGQGIFRAAARQFPLRPNALLPGAVCMTGGAAQPCAPAPAGGFLGRRPGRSDLPGFLFFSGPAGYTAGRLFPARPSLSGANKLRAKAFLGNQTMMEGLL